MRSGHTHLHNDSTSLHIDSETDSQFRSMEKGSVFHNKTHVCLFHMLQNTLTRNNYFSDQWQLRWTASIIYICLVYNHLIDALTDTVFPFITPRVSRTTGVRSICTTTFYYSCITWIFEYIWQGLLRFCKNLEVGNMMCAKFVEVS